MLDNTIDIIILCVAVLSLIASFVAISLILKNRNVKPDLSDFEAKNEKQLKKAPFWRFFTYNGMVKLDQKKN